jgi:glyoxylase I family protein
MFKRIDHVEITVSNLDRSIQFYTNVFGFKMKERLKPSAPEIEEIAFLTLGDTMLELLKMKNLPLLPKGGCMSASGPWRLRSTTWIEAIEYLKRRVEVSKGPVTL